MLIVLGHYASENDHIVCVTTRKSNIRTHGVSHTMVPSYIWLLSIWYLLPSSSWQYMFPFPCYVLKTFKLKKSLCDGLGLVISDVVLCPLSTMLEIRIWLFQSPAHIINQYDDANPVVVAFWLFFLLRDIQSIPLSIPSNPLHLTQYRFTSPFSQQPINSRCTLPFNLDIELNSKI